MRLSLPAAKRWHGGWGSYPGHRGQDFGWGAGDQVVAAAPGRVVEVYGRGGHNGGFGNRVVIQHTSSAYTTYNHLATGTITVSVGQTVTRGQLIARMGSTGKSTAKHLHFELELGGRGAAYRVDPAPYYSRDLPGTVSNPAARPQVKPKPRTPVRVGVEEIEIGEIMAFKSVGIGYRPDDQVDRLVSTGLDFEDGQRLPEVILTKSYGEAFYKAVTQGGFLILSEGHYKSLLAAFDEVVSQKRRHELTVADTMARKAG